MLREVKGRGPLAELETKAKDFRQKSKMLLAQSHFLLALGWWTPAKIDC